MERLIREEILKPLNFLDFGTCVDFIKGKFTKTKKKDVAGSSELLEITHTDSCGKMCCSSIDGDKYFITLIHHYSRYGHIYLFIEKSEDVDFFKIYKSEVEKRLGKSIQVVRSDCEGEYFGRYDGHIRVLGPFVKILKREGITLRYIAPSTLEHNGVA